MKFELNDLTPLLDLLAQPAFCTEDGVVCYCNRPARDRGLKTGVSAASLLGAGAELPAPGGAPRQVILLSTVVAVPFVSSIVLNPPFYKF